MADESAPASSSGPTPFRPVVPMTPADLLQIQLDSRQVTLLTAGVATLLASHLSLKAVEEHIKHWKRPREQRAIIAILCMIPFFAVDSYFGLSDMPGSEVAVTVLDSIRACYEAFVVSEFLVLLFSYMDISTKPEAPVPDSVKGKVLHNSFPLTLLLGQEMIVDRKSVNTLYALSRQFVVVRPVLAVLTCALLLAGRFHVGPVPWLVLVASNVSVYLAFYALLLFFHAFEHDPRLARHSPLLKFLSVKGVVFVIFWQELGIRLLVSYGVIHAGHMPFEVRQVEAAVQNFVVCVEMALAAFLFRYAFSAREYEVLPALPQEPKEKPSGMRSTAEAPAKKDEGTSKPSEAKKDK